ncbi:Fic family protein [Paenibacillus enshidis]|uniref:Fic family protein n=1 Tax=Paenibacillus enshidis TaxID=1458439 RepID=A0ABV5AMX6_9BACL
MKSMSSFGEKDIVRIIRGDHEYLQSILVRSVYNSAAIEGNSISIDETQVLLVDGFVPAFKRAVTTRELYELTNLSSVWNYILNHCTAELTISVMHEVHQLTMFNIDDNSGRFKRTQNMVGGRLTTKPENVSTEILYALDDLMNAKFIYSKTEEDIVEAVAWFHLTYEKIHPYEDGNGRTGRALVNYLLLQNNLPPVVVKVEDRAEYYSYLRTDDYLGLAKYFMKSMEEEKAFLNRKGKVV